MISGANDRQDEVVLVDGHDTPIGIRDKLEAHRNGELHRAFSVFAYDINDRLILQRRASDKYHSAGLWTNTCCGHPRPGEPLLEAAARRLWEEMGIRNRALEHRFSFIYRAELDNGLVEHELDHVLFVRHVGLIQLNAAEVMEWRAVTDADLDRELRAHPDRFSAWLPICWPQVRAHRATDRLAAQRSGTPRRP